MEGEEALPSFLVFPSNRDRNKENTFNFSISILQKLFLMVFLVHFSYSVGILEEAGGGGGGGGDKCVEVVLDCCYCSVEDW